MPKFIFAYHGGGMPETQEEQAAEMQAWQTWYGQMGAAVVDGGAPAGMSACEMAKGCPVVKNGSVEVAPLIEM